MPSSPETCPNCGADVPRGAKACPECGADEATGWSEEARYGGLDLPEEKFDYGDFVEREFGDAHKPAPPRGVSWFWWLVAIVILAAFLSLVAFR
jgi:hypothetical protein